MGRVTWILAATTAIGLGTSIYLWIGRPEACPVVEDVADPSPAIAPDRPAVPGSQPTRDACADTVRTMVAELAKRGSTSPSGDDSGLAFRARMTHEIAALLGQERGETNEQYRQRIGMLVQLGLAVPRARSAEMRSAAEAKARLTQDQTAKLDEAFVGVYQDLLASTNRAIAEGKLSPYRRDVPAWLQFGGEAGKILGDAQAQIDQILTPEQARAMYDAGFDWSEYLAFHTPWENFGEVPPRSQ